jgi:hypothetical protein
MRSVALALAAALGTLLALPAVSAAAGTGMIEGTVIKAAGKQPIKELCVAAYEPHHFFWFEGSPTYAVTNASGEYKIEVAAGSYDVRFFKCEGIPGGDNDLNYAPRYYNEQIFSAESVNVEAGKTITKIDAEMKFGGEIYGEVVGGKGQPLEGVCVDAYPETEDGPQEIVSTLSQEDGEYRLTGLQSGTYRVYYTPQYYGECTANVLPGYYDAGSVGTAAGATRITVTAEEDPADTVELLQVSLKAGAVIEGAITDSEGHAVDAPMCVKASSKGALAGYTYTETGHYRMEGLAGGSYLLEIEECAESESKPVWAKQYFNGALEPSEATLVSVSAGVEPPVPVTASFKLVRASAVKPASVVAPGIAGSAAVSQTLTCSSGSWAGTPKPTYSYQWLRDGSPIAGATATTYAVQSADEGHDLACTVTATNEAGSASETSATVQVPVKKAPAPGILVLSGPAVFRSGVVELTVSCTGQGACKGVLVLGGSVRHQHHGNRLPLKYAVTIARTSFSIASDVKERIKIHLSAKGKSLLAKAHKSGLEVRVSGSDIKASSLLIKPASKRSHRKGKR